MGQRRRHQPPRARASDLRAATATQLQWTFSASYSLAVAIQCLETTFKITSSDCHLAAPQPLKEIFLNSLLKVGFT